MSTVRTFTVIMLVFGTIITLFAITAPSTTVASPEGWGEEVRLTNDSHYTNAQVIAVNGNNIHIVWEDRRDGNNEIYYKRSIDNGENWSSDVRLTNADGSSNYPDVAVNDASLHVTWSDPRDGNNEIYYKRSSDNGDSWDSDIRLTNNGSKSTYPAIATDGSEIHIVWVDERHGRGEVYYKRSTDGGDSWGSDVRLTFDDQSCYSPTIAVNDDSLHVTWQDDRDGNKEIYYKRSNNGGTTWGDDVRLTNATELSGTPIISLHDTIIHVVWIDDRDGNYEVYYKRSINNGDSWGVDTRLTNDDTMSNDLSMMVEGENIHVSWVDSRDGNYEVYYKHGSEHGDVWENDLRITNDDDYCYDPDLASDGNNIHIVWRGDPDNKKDVFYIQRPNPPPQVDSIDPLVDHVYLGDPVIILVNGSDDSDAESDLSLTCEFRDPSTNSWQSTFMSVASWNDLEARWEVIFSPDHPLDVGSYDIRVRLQDTGGASGEWLQSIGILDVRDPPRAEYWASSPIILEGDTVTFNGSRSIGKDLDYFFDFGDGTNTDWITNSIVNHAFNDQGLFAIKLKVRDSYDTVSLWFYGDVTVVPPPKANLTADRTLIKENESVSFDAGTSTGDTLQYYFDFGDGTTEGWNSDPTVDHTYQQHGSYLATVKVMDRHSFESITVSVSITVEEIEVPVDNIGSDEDSFISGFGTLLCILTIGIVTIVTSQRKR